MKKTLLLSGLLALCFLNAKPVHAASSQNINLQERIDKLTKRKTSKNRQLELASLKAQQININSRNLKEEVAKPAQTQTTQTQKPAAAQQVIQKPIQTQQTTSQPIATAGLNLNQTSGSVDINALANYLSNVKGTFSASQWARIIMRESRGQVDAQNPYSGAYGVLQLLGHGEYRGMTLGAQINMAMGLPASAWSETAY